MTTQMLPRTSVGQEPRATAPTLTTSRGPGDGGSRGQIVEQRATDRRRLTREAVGWEGRAGRAGKWKPSRTGP